jgi:hypothetical protein
MPPQEMGRVKKTVFLLGAAPHLRKLINHLHWSHNVVFFEDYLGLLTNMREALKLDDDRLASSANGGTPPSLSEMVVSRVRELTTAAFTAVPIVVPAAGGGSAGGASSSTSTKTFQTPTSAVQRGSASAAAAASTSASTSSVEVGAKAGSGGTEPPKGGASAGLTLDNW